MYNKIDVCSMEEVDEIARRPYSVPISCYQDLNTRGLLKSMWDAMGLVRVYTKKVGARPDFAEPVVLSADRGGTRVADLCAQIHASLAAEFQYSLVWGASAKHAPQRCGTSHALADEDVVQVVKKKVGGAEEGRGRFKQAGGEYVKIADREKRKPLKT